MTPKYITNHPNYTKSDYEYLVSRGWTNRQIEARWNKEKADGKGPLMHCSIFDLVGHINK